MQIITTKPFDRDYASLPRDIQKRFDEKIVLFVSNFFHPSLRVKKMEDSRDIWEGRLTIHYRFTFSRQGNSIVLRRVGTHDVLRNP